MNTEALQILEEVLSECRKPLYPEDLQKDYDYIIIRLAQAVELLIKETDGEQPKEN